MLELAYQRDGVVARSGLITNIYVQLINLIGLASNIIIFIKDSLYRLKIADELMIFILISIQDKH